MRVRPAAVAGRFYPGDPDALAALVDALLADVPPPRRRVRPVAVVAPHAGFRFSGPVAATAYAHLAPWRGEVAGVVVLGPAHFTPLHGMAIPSVGAFATPLGPVPVDADARTVAARLSAVVVDDEPHAGEHAIETQLPFLIRALGPGVPVLPVVVGDTPPSAVATLLSTLLAAAGTIAVVSTDLSHYLNRAQARERDTHTAAAVRRPQQRRASARRRLRLPPPARAAAPRRGPRPRRRAAPAGHVGRHRRRSPARRRIRSLPVSRGNRRVHGVSPAQPGPSRPARRRRPIWAVGSTTPFSRRSRRRTREPANPRTGERAEAARPPGRNDRVEPAQRHWLVPYHRRFPAFA